jgi:hypothetical protein
MFIFVVFLPAMVNVILGILVDKEKKGDYVGLPIGIVSEEESCQTKQVFTLQPPCYITNDTFSCKLIEIIAERYETVSMPFASSSNDIVYSINNAEIAVLS